MKAKEKEKEKLYSLGEDYVNVPEYLVKYMRKKKLVPFKGMDFIEQEKWVPLITRKVKIK